MKNSLTFKVDILSSAQMKALLRDEDGERSETDIRYLNTDDFDWRSKLDNQGLYVAAFSDNRLIGVRKFYSRLQDSKWVSTALAKYGLDLNGKVYSSAYISVSPAYQRSGVASALNDFILEWLDPGDLYLFGTHEPSGKKFNKAWVSRNKNKLNLLVGENYDALDRYNPEAVNFWAQDW